MRINPFVYGLLALVVFFGVILGAQAAGFWSISGKVSASGGKITATGTNVEEIKGWMTLGEVAAAYGVSIEDIIKAFDLPADTTAAKQIKELESATFTTSGFRTWLAENAKK
jgi:hypothetical protein